MVALRRSRTQVHLLQIAHYTVYAPVYSGDTQAVVTEQSTTTVCAVTSRTDGDMSATGHVRIDNPFKPYKTEGNAYDLTDLRPIARPRAATTETGVNQHSTTTVRTVDSSSDGDMSATRTHPHALCFKAYTDSSSDVLRLFSRVQSVCL